MALIDEFIGTDICHKSDWKITAKGDLDVITGLENLRLALLHRLITSPGAFVHLPDYGVGIKDYQNAPMSLANQLSLTRRIETQFLLESRVEEVKGVAYEVPDSQPDLLKVIVRVSVVGYGETELQFIPFGSTV